jgi:hypothetical protein
MMANSARDPYWQAGVRREILDHPESREEIEDECAVCHMPMGRFQSRHEGKKGEVFTHIAAGGADRMSEISLDGVSCSLCHQIAPDKLGTPDSYVGGFVIDTEKRTGRSEYGPFKVEDGQNRIMRTSSGGYRPTESPHVRQSELCATCHTLITKALGPGGQVIGRLPEQMPYQEWYASSFRESQSCQNCHMPKVEEPTRVAVTLGPFREEMGRHEFTGANFFMLRMLNKFRGELDVSALPAEFEAAAVRTTKSLQNSAAKVSVTGVRMEGGRLQADVSVENLGGHKFPTGYPSRRTWLHVTVRDRENRLVFESGALAADGSIRGNDNDADAARFEPHYAEIASPDQVQIYEDIMVGADGVPTTGLLRAVRFVKDNRLLPKGFDKRAVDAEIAPQGAAMDDADFTGGRDTVRYRIDTGGAPGPFVVAAELWFQPVSYRWANNLRPYKAMETERFVRYYDAMAPSSGLLIGRASSGQ